MNRLRILKMAMIAYVNSVKFIWSAIAYPLAVIGSKTTKVKGYKIDGNSVQDGTPTPENPIEVKSVGELTTKNLWSLGHYLEATGSNAAVYKELSAKTYPWIKSGTTFVLSLTSYVPEDSGRTLMRVTIQTVLSDDTVVNARRIDYSAKGKEIKLSTKYTIPQTEKEIKLLRFWLMDYSAITNSVWAGYVKDIQIELGDTATEFEPYNKYKIPVTVRGKNLWNGANFLKSAVGSEILRQYVYASSNKWLKSGKSFTISVTAFVSENDTRTAPRLNATVYATDGTVITGNTVNYGEKNKEGRYHLRISMPNTTKEISHLVILFMNYSDNPGGVFDAYVKDIQIEIGSTATEFEPYVNPRTTNIYLDDPLRKVGAYKDYIDFDKGVAVRNIAEKAFDGSEYWEYDAATSRNTLLYQEKVSAVISTGSGEITAMSNRIKSGTWSNIWQNYYKSSGATNLITGITVVYNLNDGAGNKFLYVKTSPYTTLPTIEEWKTNLLTWYGEGNPFKVYYVIPSEEETVTLPSLPQFKGTTIYETDTTVPPSGIQVEYC